MKDGTADNGQIAVPGCAACIARGLCSCRTNDVKKPQYKSGTRFAQCVKFQEIF